MSSIAVRRIGGAVARASMRPAACQARWLSAPVQQTEEDEEAKRIAQIEEKHVEKMDNFVALNDPEWYVPDAPAVNMPANIGELAALDPVPEYIKEREVVIFHGEQHVMTSGNRQAKGWHLKFKPDEKWTSPLTGWTSSADPMVTVQLHFDTKEQALEYAAKRDFKAEVIERVKPRREYGTNYYAHNFLPPKIEDKLREEGVQTKHFDNPNANQSNYFRFLKFHGDGATPQHGPNPDAPIAPHANEKKN